MGELFSDRKGDGVLREKNPILPMLTIAHLSGLLMPERLLQEA
jgi:hypothetical protein